MEPEPARSVISVRIEPRISLYTLYTRRHRVVEAISIAFVAIKHFPKAQGFQSGSLSIRVLAGRNAVCSLYHVTERLHGSTRRRAFV